LKARGIDFEGAELPQENPWGYRHQINLADSGYGMRGPRVCNDRAGEIGKELDADYFDLVRIFSEEGACVFHLSGLICALSPKTGKFCLKLVKEAKKYGTIVSFDLNYRESFWKNREKELSETFKEVASLSEIIFGNDIAFEQCLGLELPKKDFKTLNINEYREILDKVQKEYPGAKLILSTIRRAVTANEHLWGAVMLSGQKYDVIDLKRVPVLDRIGGGDAYAGGFLYGMIKNWEPEKCNQFGWACGAYVSSFCKDYGMVFNENDIWEIWNSYK
jgi:2-dehydro-3-deoxygluconokinase